MLFYRSDGESDIFLKREQIFIRMKNALSSLMEACEVPADTLHIPKTNRIVEFVEYIVRDRASYDYLNAVILQMENATKKLKKSRVREWGLLETLQKTDDIEANLKGQEQKNEILEERLSDKDEELAALRRELAVAREEAQAAKEEQKRIRDIIDGLIELRDKLDDKLVYMEEEAPEETAVIKTIQGQLRATAKLMQRNQVEILDEKGVFHPEYQRIVETVSAENQEQDDTIAKVFRPGYRYNGEILRPQDVYVYAYEQGE